MIGEEGWEDGVEALSYTAREGWVSCRKTFFGSFFEERIALQGHPCMSFSKRTKRNFSFSLAQRKEVKETSTLTKPLPIWRGCKLKIAETAIFRTFWYRGTSR
jgi:hypothetical protein